MIVRVISSFLSFSNVIDDVAVLILYRSLEQIYRPHTGRIDSLALYHSLVFSGADRRVLASDYKQGK